MGRCRFVRPGVIRIALSDGEWIDVKEELTAGEQRRAMAGFLKEFNLGSDSVVDFEQYGKTKMVEYITGWSLVGFDGQPEPFDASALDALDMDTFEEIRAAINAHEAQIGEKREARKNAPDGGKGSAVTLPSPFAADGVLTGSAI